MWDLLIVLLTFWANVNSIGIPHNGNNLKRCSFFDSIPFFRASKTLARNSMHLDIELLKEFAQFSQDYVPHILREFANARSFSRSMNSREQLLANLIFRHGRNLEPEAVDASVQFDHPSTPSMTTSSPVVISWTPPTPCGATAKPGQGGCSGSTSSTSGGSSSTESTTMGMSSWTDSTTMGMMSSSQFTTASTSSVPPPVSTNPPIFSHPILGPAINCVVTAILQLTNQVINQPIDNTNVAVILIDIVQGVIEAFHEHGINLEELFGSNKPGGDETGVPPPVGVGSGFPLPTLGFPSINPPDWSTLCKLVWWPYHGEKCREMRCAACSTSVIAASRACAMKNDNHVDQYCMRDILGDGACNYCVLDYMH